jgi:hypothetical protein
LNPEQIVAVIGDGASTRKNTSALLNDWSTPNRIDRILFPGTEAMLSDAVRHVADWGLANLSGQCVNAIVSEDDSESADLTDYTDESVVVLPVPDVVEHLVGQATHLFIAWGEDDQFYSDLAERALKAGVKVYDLTDGLFPIELSEGTASSTGSEPASQPEAAQEPVTPEPAPKPEKRSQSRAAKNAAKTQSAPDEAQQGAEVMAAGRASGGGASHTSQAGAIDVEAVAQRAAEIVLERLAAAIGK